MHLAGALKEVGRARPEVRFLFVGDGPARAELEREMSDEIERVRRQFRAEIVRYEPPGAALRMRRRRA